MSRRALVWISREDAIDLGLKGGEFPMRIMDFTTMIFEVLKGAAPGDIIVLPFFWNYGDTLTFIRNRGITGPVVIYMSTQGGQTIAASHEDEGVLFLDSSLVPRTVITAFLSFLRFCQDTLRSKEIPVRDEPDMRSVPMQRDPEAIARLFGDIIRQRTKILATCQFRETLPTLTVSCEIIQMTGDVEKKLILENFSPAEFTELYTQLGQGRDLSGFYSREDETKGFNLRVESCRNGKVTAFLPDSIYDQKRKFIRVEPDMRDPVTIHVLPGEGSTLHLAVRDVSEGGVGVVTTFRGLEENSAYPVALFLPMSQVSPSAVLEPSQIVPLEISQPTGGTVALGTAQVIYKELLRDNSVYYGLSLELRPADLQNLQHYVFRRQITILKAIRSMRL